MINHLTAGPPATLSSCMSHGLQLQTPSSDFRNAIPRGQFSRLQTPSSQVFFPSSNSGNVRGVIMYLLITIPTFATFLLQYNPRVRCTFPEFNLLPPSFFFFSRVHFPEYKVPELKVPEVVLSSRGNRINQCSHEHRDGRRLPRASMCC